MCVRYTQMLLIAATVAALILSGCTGLFDWFGKSPQQMAEELIGKFFTAAATELIYVKDRTSATAINFAKSIVDGLRDGVKPAGMATPTITVVNVSEYTSYKVMIQPEIGYNITPMPTAVKDDVSKIYIIDLLVSYPTTPVNKQTFQIPMLIISNKPYFFEVFLEDGTPTYYPRSWVIDTIIE